MSTSIACHGKLPSDREYVHHQVGALDVRGFDRWVREGHRQAFLGLRASVDGVKAGYDRAGAFGFVVPAAVDTLTGPGSGLWGVLEPSRDATGRRYPFWVAWAAPPHARVPPAPAFRSVQSFVGEATSGNVLPRALGRTVEHVSLASLRDDAGDAPRGRAGGASAEPESPETNVVAPSPPADAAMDALLREAMPATSRLSPRQLLGAWMNVYAGASPGQLRTLTYGVQLPLRPGGDAMRDTAFWMEATRRLAGDPDLPLTAFWTLDPLPTNPAPASAETPPAFLLLFTTPPPQRLYAHLFTPTDDRSFVYAPAHSPPTHANDALTALPSRYHSLLDLSLTQADFLARLR